MALIVTVMVVGTGQGAFGAKAFKIIRSYTDKVAMAPLNKRILVQCSSSIVGGMEIAGPEITFFYNGISGEWCRASHACAAKFDEIATRSCEELAAVSK